MRGRTETPYCAVTSDRVDLMSPNRSCLVGKSSAVGRTWVVSESRMIR